MAIVTVEEMMMSSRILDSVQKKLVFFILFKGGCQVLFGGKLFILKNMADLGGTPTAPFTDIPPIYSGKVSHQRTKNGVFALNWV